MGGYKVSLDAMEQLPRSIGKILAGLDRPASDIDDNTDLPMNAFGGYFGDNTFADAHDFVHNQAELKQRFKEFMSEMNTLMDTFEKNAKQVRAAYGEAEHSGVGEADNAGGGAQ